MTRIIAAAVFCTLIRLSAQDVAAADRIEDFYGIWVDKNQPFTCKEVEDLGEGPWVYIGKGIFRGATDSCPEVLMHLHEGKLRVNASCTGHEEGYRDIITEIEFIDQDTISYEGGRYVRCSGQQPDYIFKGWPEDN